MPSSSRTYSLIEPHPSARPHAYIQTGRGGAGNITRLPSNTTNGATAQGPPSRLPHLSFSSARTSSTSSTTSASSRQSSAFHSGRGGVGNIHPSSERAIFSFDEELERQLSQDRHAAPVYHVGRGGAGNVTTSAYPKVARTGMVSSKRSGSRSDSDADDRGSEKSVGSVESGADKINASVRKGLRKVWGH